MYELGVLRRKAATLLDVLDERASDQPDFCPYTFLDFASGQDVRLSSKSLLTLARATAAALQEATRPSDRVVLLVSPGIEFVVAFFGCLLAGAVAVPVPLPRPSRSDRSGSRLEGILEDAGPTAYLMGSSDRRAVERLRASIPGLSRLVGIDLGAVKDDPTGRWREHHVDPGEVAFLQYTSGSTGSPRGVAVRHDNLLRNSEIIRRAFDNGPASRGVIWLPPYHDMGLIGGILQPLYAGFPCALMSPAAFLQRPVRWLSAISRFRADTSGGPNFAYELCVEKISREQAEELDLSCWTLAFNGAETVRPGTLKRFAEKFAISGFRAEAFYPCYGLAEATLFVSGGQRGSGARVVSLSSAALKQSRVVEANGSDGVSLVGCGRPAVDHELLIVDPETRTVCPPDREGEIWLRGPSVAPGYWGKGVDNGFGARLEDRSDGATFLRTGDLGFLHQGELFVNGRRKDCIIIRGANYYPQDIESAAAGSHTSLRTALGAAVSVDSSDGEKLVVLHEVDRRLSRGGEAEFEAVGDAIRGAVAEQFDLDVTEVALLKAGRLPRTSSGKIRRKACRDAFLGGTLETLWVRRWGVQTSAPPLPSPSAEGLRSWMLDRLSQKLGIERAGIDVHAPFASFGLNSKDAVGLSGELEELLGVPLKPTLLYEYPTIDLLAAHLAGESRSSPASPTSAAPAGTDAIAVVGMACRFPGAPDLRSFWKVLRDGVDAISRAPAHRLPRGAAEAPWGGFLDRVDGFDPAFFGIAPREASRMDPQQRLLLEVAWEAIADAGQTEAISGSATGVFVGISNDDYGRMQIDDPGLLDAYAGTGSALSIAANRISYLLNLSGPSLAIDTACSSSLVAVHLACQSLLRRECDLALAGGVNLILSGMVTANFAESGFLSPDGRCRTFDARANGYVRGEGAGVVVLKPLSRALRDRDSIWAVIRGTAVNQDGRSNGLTAPNPSAQKAVLRAAYAAAGIAPAAIQFVEAHGTGTYLGDPIEAEALGSVLSDGREFGDLCRLGSVKTNLGHLEAAAGIAGLIKVALALTHRKIPRSLHFETPNPQIDFDRLGLRVVTELTAWPEPERLALAGVSSFGFGGTNAHAVLEEAPSESQITEADDGVDAPFLMPLSAHSPKALRALAESTIVFLRDEEAPGAWRDVCYTAAVRRSRFGHRLAVVARSRGEAAQRLGEWRKREESKEEPAAPGKLVFLFTGQGTQWSGMGLGLSRFPAFEQSLRRSDALVRSHAGWSLLEELGRPDASTRLGSTEYAQPAVVALQIALWELFASWGVSPDAFAGHSLGEISAAVAAGVLEHEQALRIAIKRGVLCQAAAGKGGMVAVELGPRQAETLLADFRGRLVVACHNGPGSTVLSGDADAVDELVARLTSRGVLARRLAGDVAFHSPLMVRAGAELELWLASASRSDRSDRSFYSTVVGGKTRSSEVRAEYWRRNLVEPVRFAETIGALIDDGATTFVELGPHPALTKAVEDCLAGKKKPPGAMSTLRRGEEPAELLLEVLARLYESGHLASLAGLYPEGGRLVRSPAYAWQRESYWLPTVASVRGEAAHPSTVRADDPDLENWLWERIGEEKPRASTDSFIPAPSSLSETISTRSSEVLGGLERFSSLAADVEGLSAAYVLEALGALGLDPEAVNAGALAERLSVVPRHHRLLGRLLEIRAEATGDVDVPAISAARRLEELLARYPECEAELSLLGACGARLAEVLRGELDPLELIFPNQSVERLEALYQHSPFAMAHNELVRRAIAESVAGRPAGRRLKLLEIGAGTGGTTACVLPGLSSELTEYFFTDVSPWFLKKASEKFGEFPFVRYATLDIERDPSQQGFEPGSFDIVIAANVLHATSDVRRTLSRSRELLGPGGLLVMLEVTSKQRWLDLVFGLTEGWWSFADTDLRPAHPLLSRSQWLEALDGAGFVSAAALPDREETGQSVLLAQAAETRQESKRFLVLCDSGGVGEALSAGLASRGHRAIRAVSGSRFEETPDGYRLRPGNPEDLGRLIDACCTDGVSPKAVIDLFALDAPGGTSPSSRDLEVASDLGCATALGLFQALVRRAFDEKPGVYLVTRGAQPGDGPSLSVAQAPLLGFGRSARHEHPDLHGALLDIDPTAAPEDSARELLAEITEPDGEPEVWFRRGKRYVARIQRAAKTPTRDVVFRANATYLITGGLGDLGLEVARFFVERGARRLLLVGRTGLPPRREWSSLPPEGQVAHRVAAVRSLEALGASIHLAAIDVSREEELTPFLETFRLEGWPPIRGIVHAAGVLDNRTLVNLDGTRFDRCSLPRWREPGSCTRRSRASLWTSSFSFRRRRRCWARPDSRTTARPTRFSTRSLSTGGRAVSKLSVSPGDPGPKPAGRPDPRGTARYRCAAFRASPSIRGFECSSDSSAIRPHSWACCPSRGPSSRARTRSSAVARSSPGSFVRRTKPANRRGRTDRDSAEKPFWVWRETSARRF
jgi:acyl transferase domain-containing protein/acyl-CoA synthetase (AMP-forming)/AMP-acid ligase II/SAM-dependent methyltransferase